MNALAAAPRHFDAAGRLRLGPVALADAVAFIETVETGEPMPGLRSAQSLARVAPGTACDLVITIADDGHCDLAIVLDELVATT